VITQPHGAVGGEQLDAGGDRIERCLRGVSLPLEGREVGEVDGRHGRQRIEAGLHPGGLGPQHGDPAAPPPIASTLRSSRSFSSACSFRSWAFPASVSVVTAELLPVNSLVMV
jgi:hypothetical protein